VVAAEMVVVFISAFQLPGLRLCAGVFYTMSLKNRWTTGPPTL